MAKGNKYYWLKLKEDFFEDDVINWIEEQPNGKDYCLFYLKLCLKSLKSNGLLIRNVGNMLVPYDAKKLSDLTKTDIDTVTVAMDMFRKIGLVEILENGEIFMNQLNTMVGKETDYAEQKRLQRENKKSIEQKDNVFNLSLESLENVCTEKELEKEKDIDYTSIIKIWNGTNLPKLKLLSQKRKEKIKLITKEFGLDNFLKSIEILNNSKFCLGENKNNWKADLDWLIVNDTNIVKVLEGKYNDKNNTISKQQSDEESEEKYGF